MRPDPDIYDPLDGYGPRDFQISPARERDLCHPVTKKRLTFAEYLEYRRHVDGNVGWPVGQPYDPYGPEPDSPGPAPTTPPDAPSPVITPTDGPAPAPTPGQDLPPPPAVVDDGGADPVTERLRSAIALAKQAVAQIESALDDLI